MFMEPDTQRKFVRVHFDRYVDIGFYPTKVLNATYGFQ